MDFIQQVLGFSKTIKSVSRLREIVTVFAKHGFEEFITNNITTIIPDLVLPKSARSLKRELQEKSGREMSLIVAIRLRQALEELGPTFIKFGQLLSSREDIFPTPFIQELKKLQDSVTPLLFQEVRGEVEKALKGKKINEIFSTIVEVPIGTASIGVVYSAKFLDGTDVVIKVRRPNIEKVIEVDFSILSYLSHHAEKMSSDLKFIGLKRLVHDFHISLERELNFYIEASNGQKLKKNLAKHDYKNLFLVPEIYSEYLAENVIVMEDVKGNSFSSMPSLAPDKKIELQNKMEYGVELFLKTFLEDGFFHADLHGGNFFYLENGNIALVDFGLMGSISKKAQSSFIAIAYALLTSNFENLVYEFVELAEYEEIPDLKKIIQDVRDGLSPYIGLSIKQIKMTDLLTVVLRILSSNQLYLPREWFLIFRAFVTLDGVGKSLDMDLNVFFILEKDIQNIIQKKFNKEDLLEEAAWGARDLISFMRWLPRHGRWFLKDWAKKKYAFEIKNSGYEKEFLQLSKSLTSVSNAIWGLACVVCGAWFAIHSGEANLANYPILTWIFWCISGFLFFFHVKNL